VAAGAAPAREARCGAEEWQAIPVAASGAGGDLEERWEVTVALPDSRPRRSSTTADSPPHPAPASTPEASSEIRLPEAQHAPAIAVARPTNRRAAGRSGALLAALGAVLT